MRAFGGSAQAGSGIRSILRRLSRCETRLASTPCSASSPDLSGAGLLGAVIAAQLWESLRGSLPDLEQQIARLFQLPQVL